MHPRADSHAATSSDRLFCARPASLSAVKQAQRSRAVNAPNSDFYGYLRAEVASRLVDRLADINKSFPVTAEIGCGSGAFVSKLLHTITTAQSHAASDALAAAAAAANPDAARAAAASAAAASAASAASSGSEAPYISPPIAPPTVSVPSRGAIRVLHICDSNPDALRRTQEYWSAHSADIPEGREHQYHVVDEEGSLPFAPGSLDLIVSNLDMHWINDLPGFMKRCRLALKPDGVFLASMLGGSTLQELRSAFTVADMERLGGIQAHVSPFAYGRDCGDLMAAAGFSMPTGQGDEDAAAVAMLHPAVPVFCHPSLISFSSVAFCCRCCFSGHRRTDDALP